MSRLTLRAVPSISSYSLSYPQDTSNNDIGIVQAYMLGRGCLGLLQPYQGGCCSRVDKGSLSCAPQTPLWEVLGCIAQPHTEAVGKN